MAPRAPKPTQHRLRALARIADPTLPRKVHRDSSAVTDAFLNSKRDKRLVKHSAFVSKIEKARAPKRRSKTRRPSKKLVTTLESLADALPELDDNDGNVAAAAAAGGGKTRHRSLKSRPGALRKKERIVRAEVARFGANLAQLNATSSAEMEVEVEGKEEEEVGLGGDAAGTARIEDDAVVVDGMAAAARSTTTTTTTKTKTSTANRWAALRGFISATMEQNPAFVGQS